MTAGFRPGTDLDLNFQGSKITKEFGLNPDEPKVVLNPSLTRPEVAAAIDENWEQVKRSGIVTFVADTSGSMAGGKLQQAKDGLIGALDAMARNNKVGFLSFDDTVNTRIPVAPLEVNRFVIAGAVQKLRAGGQTALYDAIKAGVEMTDSVEGDADAIRAVVVLTDGQANQGKTKVDELIHMISIPDEFPIRDFQGFVSDSWATDENGRRITKQDIIGTGLALDTRHPIQIFFIGIGDADLDIGRLLAGATGAEFQGVTEDDLAEVLEEFSKYF